MPNCKILHKEVVIKKKLKNKKANNVWPNKDQFNATALHKSLERLTAVTANLRAMVHTQSYLCSEVEYSNHLSLLLFVIYLECDFSF